jgi:hypothetical protein
VCVCVLRLVITCIVPIFGGDISGYSESAKDVS